MGKASTVTSWLCCPCRCLFCGVLSCFLSVLACVLLTAGLVVLVLYLLFRPHIIHATAVSADLTNFTLTPRTWILRYNLSLALQLRNPNKRIAIHYHDVAAEAYYEGQRFAHADLPDFFQDTGESSPLNTAFLGHGSLVGGVAAAGFRREAAEGARFSIDVKLGAHMKLKLWVFRVPGPKPKIDCPLRLKRRNATAGAAGPPPEFRPTECRVWF
ncbi:NDR1/HIN1-like protein 10 [Phragmites australis]|uniref:NDR1/HIN1-like protein 10 n=1 Tax=Phragmites australis TaxID=29695 RepID=UPI002D7660FA|nr:NDR1/HIN1-like protein 10 [Phragmites australis]